MKLVITFAIMLIIFSHIKANTKIAHSNGTCGNIDLFTQKEPYNGKGPNMPSDAFAPNEKVIIYAFVTYNEWPLSSILVAFEIRGPRNPVDNITFYMYAQTDDSGIATISFRIGSVEEINFGEWKIVGTANVVDKVEKDLVSFKVGWILEVVSLRTLNENNAEQTEFGLGDYVKAELGIINIAMVEKKATLSATIYDNLNVSIASERVDNYIIPPNSSITYVYFSLYISEWASCGNATISACAYTAPISQGGVAYCPEILKHFIISHRNIAILNVYAYPKTVYIGEIVNIDLTIKNKGKQTESFQVSIFYNNTNLIKTAYVAGLLPNTNATLSFVWNTSALSSGYYQISAFAEPVSGEVHISDNTFKNGIIEVLEPIHDVAVLNVVPSSNIVRLGEILNITVVIKNKGNYVESFKVNLFYNETNILSHIHVLDLQPNTTTVLNFILDTSSLYKGIFQFGASAEPVPGEIIVSDNTFVDDIVEVKTPLHDVAILNVLPSNNKVYIGEIVKINVVVKNKGSFTESFQVVVYYNSSVIGTFLVSDLASNTEMTIVFNWTTANVAKGEYFISAFAEPVQNEENLLDNYLADGVVKIEVSPSGFFALEWVWWILLLIFLIMVILLLIWFYRRRKEKKYEKAFYSGWTAWYYGYDLKNKTWRFKIKQKHWCLR